jgi:hypothetical protein
VCIYPHFGICSHFVTRSNYMGYIRLPKGHYCFSGTVRRIDIKMFPYELRAYAIVHFTGNDLYNRFLRWHAIVNLSYKLTGV